VGRSYTLLSHPQRSPSSLEWAVIPGEGSTWDLHKTLSSFRNQVCQPVISTAHDSVLHSGHNLAQVMSYIGMEVMHVSSGMELLDTDHPELSCSMPVVIGSHFINQGTEVR
jgi:hypothetical protein